MSANFNDIVKQGIVRIKNKLGMSQQCWLILRRPSSRGPLRLEKFKNEKAAMLMETAGKSIELKAVHEVDHLRRDDRNLVVVTFENGKSFQIELHIVTEAISWTLILQEMCRLPGQREGPPGMDLLQNSNMQDIYNVFLLQTPLLNVYGECLLQITSDSIYLLDVDEPNKRIMVWPLPSLRRYSRDESKFIFESGRSCKTGEGIFIFNTVHSESIYQKVLSASNTIAIAYQLTGESRRNISNDIIPPRTAERRPLPPPPSPLNPSLGVPPPPARRP